MYELNDGYSLTINDDLRIELYRNQLITHDVLLNDEECAIISKDFCLTRKEFYHLFVDILTTTKSNVRVVDSRYLQVSFPIYLGPSQILSKKLGIFQIEFHSTVPRDDDITLDPADWTESRTLGHQIMDDMIDYLRDVRLRPTWQPIPSSVRETISQTKVPLKGESPFQVYKDICSHVLPYPVGNIHPYFWGYVQGTGSLIGAFAELITGTMNTMSWGGHQVSIDLERQVLSWLKVILGLSNNEMCSGVLVSGTSVATIIAMAVAKRKFLNRTIKVYCSKEAHTCLIRAMDLLNGNHDNLVIIPTNSDRQIDLKALEATIEPHSCAFIVGSAGTVGTGAIDDLQGLADLCAQRPNDLWFHVDGAIGAVACCSNRLRPLLRGIERADSIAFDLHKWLFVPYDCGCVLIRDGALHKATFQQSPASYLTLMDGGITPKTGEHFFCDYSLELSRGTKAIKVWMTLKTYGIEKLGQIMEQNVDQVNYFIQLLEQHPNIFEVLAKGSLNIVCFRCIGSSTKMIDSDRLNVFNQQLLINIQERGIAVVSPLVVDRERFALRMCITNHRTRMLDMKTFMEKLILLADELSNSSEYERFHD